jgi:hypothetical protein
MKYGRIEGPIYCRYARIAPVLNSSLASEYGLEAEMELKPEEFLEYADWMGIPMTPYSVTLDRFKSLLVDQARRLSRA